MSWWNEALYDGCSLVKLDTVLLGNAGLRPHFPTILALQASFAVGQVREERAARIRRFIRSCSLPPVKELRRILAVGRLPLALADVDRLVYATAVYHQHPVITGDGNLVAALAKSKLRADSIAGVLEELVFEGALSQLEREEIVEGLATRKGHLAGRITLTAAGDDPGRQQPEPAICPASGHPAPRGSKTRRAAPTPAS